MNKALFLLCPTDCLEPIIKNRFNYENYFYTSLGNSFIYNRETIDFIREIVKRRHIIDIYFVLSSNNQFFLDALGNQIFDDIRGLNSFYKEIRIQKEQAEKVCYAENLQFLVVSYYLNRKIKELQGELKNVLPHTIKIHGMVYDRYDDEFKTIYSSLIHLEKHHLN